MTYLRGVFSKINILATIRVRDIVFVFSVQFSTTISFSTLSSKIQFFSSHSVGPARLLPPTGGTSHYALTSFCVHSYAPTMWTDGWTGFVLMLCAGSSVATDPADVQHFTNSWIVHVSLGPMAAHKVAKDLNMQYEGPVTYRLPRFGLSFRHRRFLYNDPGRLTILNI